MPSFNTLPVLENSRITPEVRRISVRAPEEPVTPGQFYMLRSATGSRVLLPRPISVSDLGDGRMSFLLQVVGEGTAELAALGEGSSLHLTGPLGNGFPIEELRQAGGRVALVGGGIGVAPLLYTARRLRQLGVPADCFCGYRDETFLMEELSAHVEHLGIATESGRTGHKGLVTELLRPERYGAVFCCGPVPMMRAVTGLCMEAGTPVYLSMENRMACGIGACLVCTCTHKDGTNRRTCKDGPVFRGEEVDFDA